MFELFYRIVAKNVVQNVPPGVAPIIAAGTQYMISQGGLQYFAQQPAVYGYEEQQILPLRIPHMVSQVFHFLYMSHFLLTGLVRIVNNFCFFPFAACWLL